MPNEDGDLSQRDILNAVIDSGTNVANPIRAFNAAGKNRAIMHPSEKKKRSKFLKVEYKLASNILAVPPVKIEMSDKSVSRKLELQPLILGTILTTQSWKNSFLREYYLLEDIHEFTSRFPSKKSIDAEINQIKRKIGDYNFYNYIAEHIKRRIDKVVRKEKLFKNGSITVGLELEVSKAPTFNNNLDDSGEILKQSKKIDALQNIGIPITYDGMREIPLPYSNSAHEQLRAIHLLGQADIIQDSVGIQLNIGGLDYLDSNVLLLHQMAVAAGLFEENIKLNEDFHPLADENKLWAKHMIQDDWSSPRGMPILKHTNGVTEFRWIGKSRNFSHSAKGIQTFVSACEALGAWQRVYAQPLELKHKIVSARDQKLADLWIGMKADALRTFEEFGIPSSSVDTLYDDAEEYARHETAIRRHVITTKFMAPDQIEENSKNRSNMYNLFRRSRAKVKQILKED